MSDVPVEDPTAAEYIFGVLRAKHAVGDLVFYPPNPTLSHMSFWSPEIPEAGGFKLLHNTDINFLNMH